MAKQLSQASSSTSPAIPKFSAFDELLALVSADNLDSMLRKALSIAVRVLDAEAGSILFQGQASHHFQSGPFRAEALARIQYWEQAINKRLSDTTWNIPAGASIPISTASLTDSQLTLVNVPLVRGTAVVGSLSLVLSPGSQLTEESRDVLIGMARGVGQIASLITRLELSQQRINQLEVFHQVGHALVTIFDLNKLLSDTMQLAVNVIDAGAASIMLIDEEKQELVFEVSHGSRAKMLRQQRIPLDEGIAGWVAQQGQPVIANNARTDARFSHRVDVRTGFLTQSIAAVPLKIKGRTIGVLEVLNKYSDAGFTQEDVRLMDSIAAQAAIAIENARLYQKLRRERDHIIRAQEDIRRELARKLHDGPVQLLSAISMSLDHLERLNEVKPEAVHNEIIALRNLVNQAIRDARGILFEMRPLILETQGLVAAFEQYGQQLSNSEEFTFHFEPMAHIDYDTQVTGTIFSIVQEAINNIRRHAKARNVWLLLNVEKEQFVVIVRDDGVGFDVSQIDQAERVGHFGLLNMRERAELIEAHLQINSRTEPPNRGTTIRLSLPLSNDDALQQQTVD
ncbi:MAG: GAF domain-containing protein [Anaerolineae bacterium]|nr:GAF domain-containing protein [Anaerolineae bacterium]